MSKLILYDFKCTSCDHRYEALVTSSTLVGKCPECDSDSTRLISCPHLDPKMGLDPDNATSWDRWARVREQKAKQDKKRREEHGS
jgi:putative FmdB family regulatory protein